MGRIPGFGLLAHPGRKRLCRRLQMPGRVGQLPGRRLVGTARQHGPERADRPGLCLPLRCRHHPQRLDYRQPGHLLHRERAQSLHPRRAAASIALPHRRRAVASDRRHTPHLRTPMEPPGHVEQVVLRSPRARGTHHAARVTLAPELCRHALRPRPTLPLRRGPGRL